MAIKFLSGVNIDSNTLFVDDANNRVGIGTGAPTAKLQLYGSGLVEANVTSTNDQALLYLQGTFGQVANNAGDFYITNSAPSSSLILRTADTERMRITSAGNVGINTTSPSYKLDVIGSIRSYGGLISNGYHADTYIENLLPAANNGSGQGDVQLRMWCSEPGITWSWAGFGYNVKNDGASPYGFGRVNTSFGQAYMRFSTDGNLYFYNANTSGTRVETMTLTNGGNVGIGTTSPATKLQVDASGHALVVSNDTGNRRIYFGTGTLGEPDIQATLSNGTARELSINAAGGNVGIGVVGPTQKLHVSGNIRVTGAYYDSSNSAGSSGQVLSSTGSGTAWVNQGEATATSLYDLLPAARVAFNWTGQVVNDTWTTVFSKSSNLLTTGTWMVKMYVSDFATGGGHYTYTYSGMFTWYQDTTNQGGESAASEIYLHRMGHAANASVLYLRTTETAAASSGDGLFQIKGNYSNTSNQTISFQFVKIF